MTRTTLDGKAAVVAGAPDNVEVKLQQLIGRLADRAAYATGDEYTALRDVMTALNGLLAAYR